MMSSNDLSQSSSSHVEVLKLLSLAEESPPLSTATILKFLSWKQDPARAAARIKCHSAWRKNSPGSTFDLNLNSNERLKKMVKEGILLKTNVVAASGSPVLLVRLRKNDMISDNRTPEHCAELFMYMLEHSLDDPLVQKNGITVVHDASDIQRKNINKKIPKIMLPMVINTFPMKIKNILIINASLWVRVFMRAVLFLLPKKFHADRVRFCTTKEQLNEFGLDYDTLPGVMMEDGKEAEMVGFSMEEFISDCVRRDIHRTGQLKECADLIFTDEATDESK